MARQTAEQWVERVRKAALSIDDMDSARNKALALNDLIEECERRDAEIAEEARRSIQEQLGEAIHASLRKASDHPAANTAWHAIRGLPDEEWRKVLEFAWNGMVRP